MFDLWSKDGKGRRMERIVVFLLVPEAGLFADRFPIKPQVTHSEDLTHFP